MTKRQNYSSVEWTTLFNNTDRKQRCKQRCVGPLPDCIKISAFPFVFTAWNDKSKESIWWFTHTHLLKSFINLESLVCVTELLKQGGVHMAVVLLVTCRRAIEAKAQHQSSATSARSTLSTTALHVCWVFISSLFQSVWLDAALCWLCAAVCVFSGLKAANSSFFLPLQLAPAWRQMLCAGERVCVWEKESDAS